MTISPETRLAMLGLTEAELTPDLRAVVADWAARCDALTACAKARLDPYETPLTARVSPFGPLRPEGAAGFRLATGTRPADKGAA